MKILTTTLALVAVAASPAAELPSSITEAVEAKIARRCGEPVKGHDNFVAHVAFSKDGKMALSASWDGSIKLWETRKGKEKKVLVGHDEPLYWAGFFEDGKRVVSTSMDQTLRIWNAKSGKELSRVDAPEKLQIASLSPDGKLLAAAGPQEKVIRLYDLSAEGTPVTELPHQADGMLLALAFSPDGTQLASAGMFGSFVQVHDVAKREVLFAEEAPFGVSGLAWAPDGASLFLGGNDALVQWGIAEKDVLDGMGGHEETTRGLSVSADGSTVYFGDGGGGVRGWKLVEGEQVFYAGEHRDTVTSTSLSPDGTMLMSGSHDGTVRFWDVETQRETLVAPGHTNLVQALAWSADGKRLASGSYDNSVCLWEASSGKMANYLTAHEYSVIGVAFVGERCISAGQDNTVRFWSADGVEEAQIAFGEEEAPLSAFAAHGTRGVAGTQDGSLHLLDLAAGKIVKALEGHDHSVSSVAWSPSGKVLATTGWDGRLQVFDADGTRVFTDEEGDESGLEMMLFIEEKTVLVVTGEGRVIARAAADGAERWAFDLGEEGWIGAIAVTSDGETLALACSDGLCFHDASDGKRRFAVPTPDGAFGGMAFSPDGQVLATGMLDSTVLLWRMKELEAAK